MYRKRTRSSAKLEVMRKGSSDKERITTTFNTRADAADVVALRKQVQKVLGLGTTAAQDWCAGAVCSQRRAWQQWERGERAIHPGICKLARIEIARIAHTAE